MSKRFAIIGGTSGIGEQLIKNMLGKGEELHVACRRPAACPEGVCTVQSFDALEPGPLEWPAQLDGLVYFPGTIALKPFQRCGVADFLRDLQVNLLGAVHCLQSAQNALKAAPRASVVLFSTVAVVQGMPFHSSIAAAKAGVEGLARSLAAEWAPRVRVNVIAPSLTDTPLAASLLSDDAKKAAAAKRHPTQMVGKASEMASLVEFLLDDASSFMTGQILRPDGGLSSVRLFS